MQPGSGRFVLVRRVPGRVELLRDFTDEIALCLAADALNSGGDGVQLVLEARNAKGERIEVDLTVWARKL